MFEVIGYNDEVQKYSGPSTRFPEDKHLRLEVLPSQDQLRGYATSLGCYPSDRRGTSPTKCEPVYFTHDHLPGLGNMANPFKPVRAKPVTPALKEFLSRH